ncbi:hypothetical protein F5B17DRAFT_431744 [Nemania serpens]|nr:hypothetical protein F5B17DRAFT_431744 [Nemania serpens]
MSEVPSECFHIPLFERRQVEYSERPECEVFMVKCTIAPHIKVRCWCTTEGRANLQTLYKDLPEFDEDRKQGGFVNGRPMSKLSVPVFTCTGQERPQIFYRVVHHQQPYYGRKARGYGLVKVTPLMFQMLVDRHLKWQCRQPSPFMSATNSWEKAERITRVLQKHGCTGIQIIEFRSSGPGWDHKAQRIFYVPRLGEYLNTPNYYTRPYYQDDYLVESHIPPESILSVKDIEDVQYVPAMKISKKRKDPENGEEVRISSKRSRNFMRARNA